ncbi:sugar ABC transporter ATP-binding protein [Actinobacteria bacterium YIM 96077]|uniref:D-xylose ABC transporter ATP-binding protein n=1 Tax=Phytoactinopolyspora halophila TaxID=1981511 RepID=A0A329QTX8_9ACTN|nr:sugar ABC transporter ATP-binding protein [Phytoactinopolyspora halophila]AYY14210.1 sugar ABC transporter ATP-binding protein [Actinobacteria bacterium YIM 96077]RAW14752.1 D-xylose ABC transporter ATP-binding protein [Phytoactinopolyspora halophila]
MTDHLLEIDGVSKGFPGVQALSGVHLQLDAGEVHALVGENGAGKSTLMKILAGIYQEDSGTIRVNGRPVHIDSPRTAQNLGISIIHQELSLMPDLTIAENIYIGRERRRGLGFFMDDRDLNRRAGALFDQLGISLDPRTKAGDLLVAQQQVVEIAKAMSFDARILIMDEPTAALTDSETETLFGLIRDLRQHHTGIIYISHRLEELTAISDRITVLRDGSYIDTLATPDTDLRHVIALMVGREIKGETRPAVPRETRPTALEVTGLSTKSLLKDVSFDLREGEILGFAGLMGAGRTEVARAICGADRPDHGDITVHGQPVKIKSPSDAARLGIGYLSEDRKRFGLMLDQDVGFNISISSIPSYTNAVGLVRDNQVRQTARHHVESLKVKTPSIAQQTTNLSGGNQQKVVIAKWLARDCDILIFDEPTRGIDVGAKEEIYDLLTTLADQGKSIIMISSELPEILRLSHRIVVMCEGRVTGVLDNADADQEILMDYATRAGAHGGMTV